MTAAASHAQTMDGVYRYQRHVYDLTRRYYLLGRDRLIAELDGGDGANVLEIGCGTGRNLIAAATRHPTARFHGLDISNEMLATARRAIRARHLDDQIQLAHADATDFDPERLFGRARFDRVYLSYTLSMIPEWERALTLACDVLALGGRLSVVDFGQQEGLPHWFRAGLRGWLARFHVTPRANLPAELAAQAERIGGRLSVTPLHRGYACYGVLTRPATLAAHSAGSSPSASAAGVSARASTSASSNDCGR